MVKQFTIILIFALTGIALQAQQLPQMSHRMLDQLYFNPAVAGSNEYPEIKMHHRSQWTGFKGAPETSLLSYHSTLMPSMGIGGYLYNDITGPTNRMAACLAYAYHIPVSRFFVSLGLSVSLLRYSIAGQKVTLDQTNDMAVIQGTTDRAWKPDASFGVYAYNEKFYVGGSLLQLFNSKVDMTNSDSLGFNLCNHYYGMAGVDFYIQKKFKIEPSILISKAKGAPAAYDVDLSFYYKNQVVAGLTFRYEDALVLLLGYRFGRFFISYSYDMIISKMKGSNSGSHEIIFAYRIPGGSNKTKPMFDLKGPSRGQIKRRVY